MRIITGYHKGKVIRSRLDGIRPTTDFAKSGLFNFLQNHFNFQGLSVIDLCAGTGNISFEFAARGAVKVTSVDSDVLCLKFIRHTADGLSFKNIITVKSDIIEFLKRCHEKADIIFADPPYEFSYYELLHSLVFSNQLLNAQGMLIVEHSRRTKLSSLKGFLEERIYGNVHFSYFLQSLSQSPDQNP